jgi:hypothetical protein
VPARQCAIPRAGERQAAVRPRRRAWLDHPSWKERKRSHRPRSNGNLFRQWADSWLRLSITSVLVFFRPLHRHSPRRRSASSAISGTRAIHDSRRREIERGRKRRVRATGPRSYVASAAHAKPGVVLSSM